MQSDENQPPQQKKFTIDEFYVGKLIGNGNFTTIFEAEHLKTKQKYALKQALKQKLTTKNKFGDMLMERHCLTRLRSNERVVSLFGTFQDATSIYLLMERLQGPELWNKIRFFGAVDRNYRQWLMREIALAVDSIHKSGIVHRDIKPENIVFSGGGALLKFVDFGSAKDEENPDIRGSGNSSTGRKVFHHFVGTPNYMAPECLNEKFSSFCTDIFALGMKVFLFSLNKTNGIL